MKYIRNYVVFSIDENYKLQTTARFMRYIAELSIMNKLKMEPVLCMGSYDDVLEYSFVMDRNDYNEFIVNTKWVSNQESILVLNPINPRSNELQGYLHYETGTVIRVGKMYCIEKEDIHQYNAWTYAIAEDKYYVCK